MSGCAYLRTFALKARLFPIFMATKLIHETLVYRKLSPFIQSLPKQFGRSAGSSPDQRLISESKERGTERWKCLA